MSEPEDAEYSVHLVAETTTVRNIEVEGGAVSVQTTSTEHADIRRSRLRREEESAKHRRWIEKAVLTIAGIIVGAVMLTCLVAVFHPEVADSNRDQA